MQKYKKKFSELIFLFLLTGFWFIINCQQTSQESSSLTYTSLVKNSSNNKIVGELFGIPVPQGNYYFAKRVVLSFNAKWRPVPQSNEELEDLVWQELVLSYEAFRRGIEASEEDIDKEIDKIVKSEKIEFDWRQDKGKFREWIERKLNVSPDVFRNYIAHLVKLEKLRQEVLDSIEPEVNDEEAFKKFLDEYNTLSVELIRFDELEEAKRFYERVKKDPRTWDKEKEKNPQEFKKPGFVALDFLLHMWKFRREDVYKMIEKKKGDFYPPSPIYKGYAVFKILKVRKANREEFVKRKDYYRDKIKTIKKYQGFKDWLEELKRKANIKVYTSTANIPF